MKYMGSKSRFAKHILPIILENRSDEQWYIEPFAGGMNMIAGVSGNRVANDLNKYLIKMWENILDGWVPEKIDKEEYLKVRDNKDQYPDYYVGWVGFNCSYSGKWFAGFAGDTITKIGKIRDYQSEAIKNILNQRDKMVGILFKNEQYFNLNIPDDSIIYCDPPYQGTTKYFSEFDHDLFWYWVRNQEKNGNKVFVSEYDCPDDFECIWQKTAKSSLSANGKSGSNKTSIEKLFTLRK